MVLAHPQQWLLAIKSYTRLIWLIPGESVWRFPGAGQPGARRNVIFVCLLLVSLATLRLLQLGFHLSELVSLIITYTSAKYLFIYSYSNLVCFPRACSQMLLISVHMIALRFLMNYDRIYFCTYVFSLFYCSSAVSVTSICFILLQYKICNKKWIRFFSTACYSHKLDLLIFFQYIIEVKKKKLLQNICTP